jgi:hypothetical protein
VTGLRRARERTARKRERRRPDAGDHARGALHRAAHPRRARAGAARGLASGEESPARVARGGARLRRGRARLKRRGHELGERVCEHARSGARLFELVSEILEVGHVSTFQRLRDAMEIESHEHEQVRGGDLLR